LSCLRHRGFGSRTYTLVEVVAIRIACGREEGKENKKKRRGQLI